ncbi:glycosyltransferase [Variovorax sp. UC122_21]|uniref:glycosyltransferase n=1 Tax=Variovorax sp. UC122_21 TaxID=3374554 RepID=UPI0037575B2D
MIGRFLGAKGVREYVEAARIIRAQRQGVFFDLVGWIDDNPDAIAKDELNDWIACGIINYVGRLDDVRPAIANASVFVLPSYREGTPRTVLEAMSMGRAVITTDAPGCKETVVSGENGFLIPVASVDDLVGAMIRFLTTRALLKRWAVKLEI